MMPRNGGDSHAHDLGALGGWPQPGELLALMTELHAKQEGVWLLWLHMGRSVL